MAGVKFVVVSTRLSQLKDRSQAILENVTDWYYENRDWVWYPFTGIVAILATGIFVMRYLS